MSGVNSGKALSSDRAFAPRRSKSRPVKNSWQWTKSQRARAIFSACRWLHVYVSSALFGLLIFFCVTGIFLNHLDWFESEGAFEEVSKNLPEHLRDGLARGEAAVVDDLKVFINQEWGLENPRKVDMDFEVGEVVFDFSLPAGYALVTFEAGSDEVLMEKQKGTVLAVLNDLHKGRHTGAQWSWVIDLSAVLITFLSLTGLVILFQQAKWRLSGLVLVIAGVLAPFLIYLIWVPK